MRRALALALLAATVLSLAVAVAASARQGSRFRPAVRGAGVVATEALEASRAGKAVLDRGGTAMDAAVTAVFAINAVRPQSCGIGGGGFLVHRTAAGEVATLDFRETAPAAITPTSFAGPGRHRAFTGHLTVGVPGTVAGLDAALRRYGTISLAEAIEPGRKLAEGGFAVPQSLSESMAQNAPRLRMYPAAANQFLVGGTAPYPPGSRLVQPDLAKTLATLQREGPDAFYRGSIAERIVADMRNSGEPPTDAGVLTREDLARYRAVWREPLIGSYRGREVLAAPPPTSGGIATLEMLNVLEGFDLAKAGQSSADALHFLGEAEKIAFADRNRYVADPDQVQVPTAGLIAKDYAAARRAEIDPQRAKSYGPGKPAGAPPGSRAAGEDANPLGSTTSLSVIDNAGNAVALTCTIEQSFGSAVVAPGTGFLLNNELTDFSAAGTANEPRPGKRPRSSISPTIVVEGGRPVLAIGGAGGATIIMGSLLGVVQVVDFGQDVAQAVDAERLDEQTGAMQLENARVAPAVQAELERRGHVIAPQGEYGIVPRVQAAGIDLPTGERLGVSDPRTDDAAMASTRPPAPAPAAPAPGRPATGPSGVRCQDRTAPRVRARARAARRRLVVRGRAADRGCAGGAGGTVSVAGRVERVLVSVARVRGGRCAFAGRGGRLARPRSCRRPRYLTARGTSAFRLRLGRLARGSYRVRVLAVDGRGNRSRATARRVRIR